VTSVKVRMSSLNGGCFARKINNHYYYFTKIFSVPRLAHISDKKRMPKRRDFFLSQNGVLITKLLLHLHCIYYLAFIQSDFQSIFYQVHVINVQVGGRVQVKGRLAKGCLQAIEPGARRLVVGTHAAPSPLSCRNADVVLLHETVLETENPPSATLTPKTPYPVLILNLIDLSFSPSPAPAPSLRSPRLLRGQTEHGYGALALGHGKTHAVLGAPPRRRREALGDVVEGAPLGLRHAQVGEDEEEDEQHREDNEDVATAQFLRERERERARERERGERETDRETEREREREISKQHTQ